MVKLANYLKQNPGAAKEIWNHAFTIASKGGRYECDSADLTHTMAQVAKAMMNATTTIKSN